MFVTPLRADGYGVMVSTVPFYFIKKKILKNFSKVVDILFKICENVGVQDEQKETKI